MRAILSALSVAAALLAVPLFAAPARAQSAALEMAHQADQLRPGQWVWTGEISPSGPVVVHVDLSRQLVTVYRNGVRIGVSTASTGRRGHETPTGVFTVLQKKRHHRSNLYNNAPMPYMIRLTWDGVALHGGAVRDRPVSHGCIRLPMQFARELFRAVPMGGTVVVEGDPTERADGPGAGVLAPFGVGGAAENRERLRTGQSYSWRPSASPFGPVTIVMSMSDQHVVVVRNGVEIGRARAAIPADVRSTRLLERTEAAQWVQV
ncbi:MAG: L,D-transpeptidase family protein, partial [Vitreimonas sp.]